MFKDARSLEEIEIHGDVRELGASAFSGCLNLHTLKMNYVGERLPAYAFYQCEKLNITPFLTHIKVLESYSLASTTIDDSFQFPQSLERVKTDALNSLKLKYRYKSD